MLRYVAFLILPFISVGQSNEFDFSTINEVETFEGYPWTNYGARADYNFDGTLILMSPIQALSDLDRSSEIRAIDAQTRSVMWTMPKIEDGCGRSLFVLSKHSNLFVAETYCDENSSNVRAFEFWTVGENEPDWVIQNNFPGSIYDGAFNGDDSLLVLASNTRFYLYRLREQSLIKEIETNELRSNLMFTPDNRFLLSGDGFVRGSRAVALWDIERGSIKWAGPTISYAGYFNPSHTEIWVHNMAREVEVWSYPGLTKINTVNLNKTLCFPTSNRDCLLAPAKFSSSGKYFGIPIGSMGAIDIFETATFDHVRTLRNPTINFNFIKFNPRRHEFMTAGTRRSPGGDLRLAYTIWSND